MKLPQPLFFDWDLANIDKNWITHQATHKEIEEVFFNRPLQIFSDHKHSQEESRYLALGKNNQDRKLTVIFTIRFNQIRVISARDQSRKERKIYEQKS